MRVIYPLKGLQYLILLLVFYNLLSSTQICSYRPVDGNVSYEEVNEARSKREIVLVEESLPLKEEEGSGMESDLMNSSESTTAEVNSKGGKKVEKEEIFKGSRQELTCIAFNWMDIFWNKLPNQLFNIWLACLLLCFLCIVIDVEIIYYHCTGKDQTKLAVWLVGLVHVLLTGGVIINLLYFRLNWDRLWSELFFFATNTPSYPMQWLAAEMLIWTLLVFYLLEIFFYRRLRGDILLVKQLDTYNVAQMETTYISAYKEPLVSIRKA